MQEKVVKGLETIAEGAITIELESLILSEFDEYMARLSPHKNKRNPW
jgi:metabotropic glutamate receptor 2/3